MKQPRISLTTSSTSTSSSISLTINIKHLNGTPNQLAPAPYNPLADLTNNNKNAPIKLKSKSPTEHENTINLKRNSITEAITTELHNLNGNMSPTKNAYLRTILNTAQHFQESTP